MTADSLRKFLRSPAAQSDRSRVDIEVLGLIANLQRSRSVSEVFDFLMTISDPEIKRDGFLFFAAYTVEAGTAPDFWKLLETPKASNLGALGKIAIFRGFVIGISNQKNSSTSSSTATTKATSGAE